MERICRGETEVFSHPASMNCSDR